MNSQERPNSDGSPSIAQGRAALQEAAARKRQKVSYTCMKMTFEEAREKLKAVDIRPMLTPSKGRKYYQCPFCGSGTHGNRTGAAKYYQDDNKLFCHACENATLQGRAADAIDIYQYTTGAAGHAAAVFEMADEYGIEITDRSRPEQARRNPPKKDFKAAANDLHDQAAKPATAGQNGATETTAAAPPDFSDYIAASAARLMDPAAVEYITQERGISLETVKRIRPAIGFDPAADTANAPGGKGQNLYPAPRIIIPSSNHHYFARAISANEYPKLNAGSPGIFNAAALHSDAAEIFVTESAFNVLSIMEAGAQAVAIYGAGGGAQLLQALQGRQDELKATLLICFDNDPDATTRRKIQREAAELAENLNNAGFDAIIADINGGHNDANDFLREDRPAFMAAVKEAQKMAAEHRASGTPAQPGRNGPKNDFDGETRKVFDEPPKMAAEMARTNTPRAAALEMLTQQAAARKSEIDALLQEISTDRYKPIPTGIEALDAALDGGMISQTLVFLGAEPGAGKTALATQIFENMARDGRPAIYYNLEMAREFLQARSLARIAYRGGTGPKLTAIKVLRAYNAPKTTRRAIEAAAEDYKTNIAPYLKYSAGSSNLDDLLQDMNAAAQTAEEAGQPAPHICIDYLQLITGGHREDAQATIKRAVDEFKQYAIDHNAIVFVIIAQNRRANEEDKPTLQAGRDSSAIEYSGDLQLQLTGRTNKDGKRIPGEKTLHITKSRYIQAQTSIKFKFKGGQSYFEAAAEAETEMTFRNGESDTVI